VSFNKEGIGYDPRKKRKSHQNFFAKETPLHKSQSNSTHPKKAFQKPFDRSRMTK